MGTALSKRPHTAKKQVFLLLAICCFGFSSLVHFLFFQQARHWVMPGFSPESYDKIIPRTFRMKRVEIDPRTLDEKKAPEPKQREQAPVDLPKDTPQMDYAGISKEETTILSKPRESIPQDKTDTQISSTGLENVLPRAQNSIDPGMMADISMKASSSSLKMPEPQDGKGLLPGEGKEKGLAQFSSLDDLLGDAGMVKNKTAPILMPTDLLFEYDSAMLKPEADATLTKLGSLIQKNAQASFRIEGHTDSFGTDDYNIILSLRRAEAVKNWLTSRMGLDVSRISTIGFGKKRLLVPATGTVEQQQLNRRVEIVISVPK